MKEIEQKIWSYKPKDDNKAWRDDFVDKTN